MLNRRLPAKAQPAGIWPATNQSRVDAVLKQKPMLRAECGFFVSQAQPP
jgi:hypothetical protein